MNKKPLSIVFIVRIYCVMIKFRYVLLHNLNQLADDLREWEIQEDLTAEVYRLRIQLQLAEERLAAQRAKTTEMSPRTAQKHITIHEERNQCSQLTKLCQEMGLKLVGPAYKYSIHFYIHIYILVRIQNYLNI